MIKAKDIKSGVYYKDDTHKHWWYCFSNVQKVKHSYYTTLTCDEYYFSEDEGANWKKFPYHSWRPDLEFKLTQCGAAVLPSVSHAPNFGLAVKMEEFTFIELKGTTTTKKIIPENKTSKYCIQCKNPNKEIVLFRSTTYYCPICEP